MKKNIFYTILPLFLAGIVTLITKSDFNSMVKPPFSPPSWLFPIVWTILYLLMGYTFNIIRKYNDKKTNIIFFVQLFLNLTWTIIFFKFKLYLLSVIWIILLIISVNQMLLFYYSLNKKAAYLNLPYFIWLLIAYYLTVGVYILN